MQRLIIPMQPDLISTVNCQLSTVNCQLSTVNCQLSTVNCQLFLPRISDEGETAPVVRMRKIVGL
ncbi:hypothetical protein [Microcoleus sp. CAWBG58]|uniref:hypothetical protein n=1 Tax=Microcoleus sp. CAWBG58 TaxID=2841651 RepID=UPI0025D71D7B|nr:hypothetical protein [Microcoleus sp. CAWBG58]